MRCGEPASSGTKALPVKCEAATDHRHSTCSKYALEVTVGILSEKEDVGPHFKFVSHFRGGSADLEEEGNSCGLGALGMLIGPF